MEIRGDSGKQVSLSQSCTSPSAQLTLKFEVTCSMESGTSNHIGAQNAGDEPVVKPNIRKSRLTIALTSASSTTAAKTARTHSVVIDAFLRGGLRPEHRRRPVQIPYDLSTFEHLLQGGVRLCQLATSQAFSVMCSYSDAMVAAVCNASP